MFLRNHSQTYKNSFLTGLQYQTQLTRAHSTTKSSKFTTPGASLDIRNAILSNWNKAVAHNTINQVKFYGSTAGIKKSMQALKGGNRGWIWGKILTVSAFGDHQALNAVRTGRYASVESDKTPDVARSLVVGGLTNVYRPIKSQQKPFRPAVVGSHNLSKYYRTTFYKLLRLRFERWFFKCLGGRTYIWFSNIWRDVTSRVNSKVLANMYSTCMRRLAVKGSRFYMEPQQAHIVFQSIFLAVTSITGLQFFMKMMSTMISMFRSHWQLVRHLMGLFYSCKNYFWFKSLYNYRLIMRGKFGGQLRARQEVFQHGVVKIHQWDQNVNYARIFPVTIYGVFSVRFWLQMRDMRILRLVDATGDILRYRRTQKTRRKHLVGKGTEKLPTGRKRR